MDNLVRSDERRRIARELHDSTSQLLIALQLQLTLLRRHGVPGDESLLDEMEQVLRDIQESINHVASRKTGEGVEGARARVASVFYSLGDRAVR